jgi:hypothetical protein
MKINDSISAPRVSLRAIYRRYAWNARSLLALHPWIFVPVMRLKPRERSWMVQDNTQFVIEGFPRSANTFAVMAFAMSQTENVNVSHHMHAPVNVMLAAARNLPTLVLIRHPLDAIASLAVKYPYNSVSQACKYYIRYYKTIAPYHEKYLLSTFEEVTSDFGAVMADVNRKFGTHFGLFEHSEENLKACFSQMSSITLPLIAGVDVREAQAHYPSALRDRWKATVYGVLRSDKYRKLLATAEDVYAQMLANRSSPEAKNRSQDSTQRPTQTRNATAGSWSRLS